MNFKLSEYHATLLSEYSLRIQAPLLAIHACLEEAVFDGPGDISTVHHCPRKFGGSVSLFIPLRSTLRDLAIF